MQNAVDYINIFGSECKSISSMAIQTDAADDKENKSVFPDEGFDINDPLSELVFEDAVDANKGKH